MVTTLIFLKYTFKHDIFLYIYMIYDDIISYKYDILYYYDILYQYQYISLKPLFV